MTTLIYGSVLVIMGVCSAVIAAERDALDVYVVAVVGAAVGSIVALIGVGQILGGLL